MSVMDDILQKGAKVAGTTAKLAGDLVENCLLYTSGGTEARRRAGGREGSMKVVLQRVKSARIVINESEERRTGQGLFLLVGVTDTDTERCV